MNVLRAPIFFRRLDKPVMESVFSDYSFDRYAGLAGGSKARKSSRKKNKRAAGVVSESFVKAVFGIFHNNKQISGKTAKYVRDMANYFLQQRILDMDPGAHTKKKRFEYTEKPLHHMLPSYVTNGAARQARVALKEQQSKLVLLPNDRLQNLIYRLIPHATQIQRQPKNQSSYAVRTGLSMDTMIYVRMILDHGVKSMTSKSKRLMRAHVDERSHHTAAPSLKGGALVCTPKSAFMRTEPSTITCNYNFLA